MGTTELHRPQWLASKQLPMEPMSSRAIHLAHTLKASEFALGISTLAAHVSILPVGLIEYVGFLYTLVGAGYTREGAALHNA